MILASLTSDLYAAVLTLLVLAMSAAVASASFEVLYIMATYTHVSTDVLHNDDGHTEAPASAKPLATSRPIPRDPPEYTLGHLSNVSWAVQTCDSYDLASKVELFKDMFVFGLGEDHSDCIWCGADFNAA